MTPNPIALPATATLLDATRAIAGTRHRYYPVVDDGHLVGALAREELDQAARDGRTHELVRDRAITPRVIATAGERVTDVLCAQCSSPASTAARSSTTSSRGALSASSVRAICCARG